MDAALEQKAPTFLGRHCQLLTQLRNFTAEQICIGPSNSCPSPVLQELALKRLATTLRQLQSHLQEESLAGLGQAQIAEARQAW